MSSDKRPDWRDRSRWPDPMHDSGGPTTWTSPARDYATATDGSSPWRRPTSPQRRRLRSTHPRRVSGG